MSVETELGLGSNLESVIADAWPSWATAQPALGEVDDPCRLRSWLQNADPAEADEVVYGLAWLASTEGGNDRHAAQALAWLLVPGASFLARQLRTLSRDIDHMVAAELWILVCTFPLHRRKVIRNLMWDLRANVLAACEAPATLQRKDPTWYASVASLDSDLMADIPAEHDRSAMEELADVLDWAYDHRVIAAEDRQLVLLLVEASQDLRLRQTPSHGLLGNEATATVAALLGVCERTVRRRARRTIWALTTRPPPTPASPEPCPIR